MARSMASPRGAVIAMSSASRGHLAVAGGHVHAHTCEPLCAHVHTCKHAQSYTAAYSRSFRVNQHDPQELGSQVLSDGGQIRVV